MTNYNHELLMNMYLNPYSVGFRNQEVDPDRVGLFLWDDLFRPAAAFFTAKP